MNNLTKLARRQLAMHEALRRLGFKADDIYTTFYNDEIQQGRKVSDVFTELRVDGKIFKTSFVGEKKVERTAYAEVYKREVEWWNGEADEEKKRYIYQKEFSTAHILSLIEALKAKRFTIPRLKQGDA